MARTAPAPNIPAIPGMCPGAWVAAGGAGAPGSGGSSGSGGDGDEGAGTSKKDDDASGDGNDGESVPPDYAKYPTCGYKSHPVDVVTGRAFTHPITDLELPGPLPFEFSRMYSSIARKKDVGLGYGWAHSLGWRLEVARRSITVWNEQGTKVVFDTVPPGGQILGRWGWVLRRESFGYALDTGDDLWRVFMPADDRGEVFRLAAIQDRNGNRTLITYDDNRLVEITDSAGRKIRVQNTHEGRIASLSVMNASSGGRWITFASYTYNAAGDLISVTDADGYTAHYEYDDKHRLTKDTDRAGLSFHFRYDREDRCIESWGDYGGKRDPSLADDVPEYLADKTTKAKGVHHCKFDYMEGDYTEVADSTNVERYFGNKFGTLDKSVIGGATTTSRYDERGFLIEEMDALEAVTKWKRDERGRVLEVVDPLGRTTVIERDASGLPVKVTDPAGGVTTAHRDPRGNLQVVTDQDAVSSYAYDERGLMKSETEPNGATAHYEYDAHGNVTGLRQPNGGVWQFAYDGFGRLVAEVDPTGAETRYTYSNRGDLLAVYDSVGGVTRYSHDGEGHLTQVVSPKGHVTQFYWGGYHKLSGRRDANGHVVRLTYNREGELVEVHNERGEIHRLFYDPSGGLIGEETFDHRRLKYKNDLEGRPVRIENGAGEAMDFQYDPAGQLIGRELFDDSEVFEYNARGELVLAKNGTGEFRLERDSYGRIVRESQKVAGTDHWIHVAYDHTGARMSRETSLGHTEHIQRDGMGARVRTLLDGRHQIDHVNDVFAREVQRRLPGGGMIESAFDRMGRLAHRAVHSPVKHRPVGPDEPEWVGRMPEGTSAYTTYQYDLDGELIEKNDLRRGKTEYRYDPVGQLLSSIPAKAREELFRYDPTGNIHEAGDSDPSRRYGAGNRLLQKGNTHYEWDDDGRLSRKREVTDGGERTWQYIWNGAGLLQRVDTPDGSRVEFSYDPFGRRMEKRLVSHDGERQVETSTLFVWDGSVPVHEVRDGAEQRRFLFSDDDYAPAAESVGSTGAWRHFANDAIGTPVDVVDSSGQVLDRLECSAWGSVSEGHSAPATTPLRFQGQYADDETGLHYNRFRYYDPAIDRFISQDPVGLAAGMNSYSYGVNPVSWVDPFGLWAKGSKKPRVKYDNKDRLKSVEAHIRPEDIRSGTSTNDSSRKAARERGCNKDDAGHPIARALGGEGGIDDVFPQDPHTNRGDFRKHEKWVREQVEAKKKVKVKVTLHYKGDSTRPSSVTYETTVNGKKYRKKFQNPVPK